jgi:3-hydroxybutyryl-CoA dehydrogenase
MSRPKIAVIGAGLMGHGIAQVFALAGHDVTIYDTVMAALDSARARVLANVKELGDDQAAIERITPCHDLREAVRAADYVVEAVLEDLPLKQQLFAEIEGYVRPDTILASNTSVIPITKIMEGLKDRSRALGTHWWNPPYLVPLVEVIGTQWTAPKVIDWTIDLHKAAGKMPVHVKKDVPGFVGNRLQHALWREAIALVEHGICDAETVDAVIKASFGRRLAVLGPLENADLVGTDLALAIHQTVLPAIESRPGPSPYLEKLVADGKLGFKSGEGFRKWTAEQQQALRAQVLAHLKKARAWLARCFGLRDTDGRSVQRSRQTRNAHGRQSHHQLRDHRLDSHTDHVGRAAGYARPDRRAGHRRGGSRRGDPAFARARSQGRPPDRRS